MKFFLPALVWAIIIFFLSTKGGINLPPSLYDLVSVDKIGHAVFYGILCSLIYFGFHKRGFSFATAAFWSLGISTLYGVLLEFCQNYFFPQRHFEYYDIVADILGALLSLLVIHSFFVK